jgi:hypothetical protein
MSNMSRSMMTSSQRSGPWGKDGANGYAWNSRPSPLRDFMRAET